MLKVALARGGAGIRRWSKNTVKKVDRAASRATRNVGRKGRTGVRKEVARLVNVPPKHLRGREWYKKRKSGLTFNFRIYRREYQIAELKNTRFNPYAGGDGSVGTLRFTAYGKRHTFRNVRQKMGRHGYRYSLIGDGGRRGRRIMGTWVKEDYRKARRIKLLLPRRWKTEFRRQLKKTRGR